MADDDRLCELERVLREFPLEAHPGADMLDIAAPDLVSVEIREDGTVLWVNVDGRCVLRLCRIKSPIQVQDNRIKNHGPSS